MKLSMILFTMLALSTPQSTERNGAAVVLQTPRRTVRIDHLYFETARGRTTIPSELTRGIASIANRKWTGEATTADGHRIRLSITPQGTNFGLSLTATPAADITKWGLAIEAKPDEYFTGLMERVVDGPQQASWAPGISAAMNLRGQKIDMLVKPTTSIYAPFYISSRGYAVFVNGSWPGTFDFEASQADRAQIEFEGPSFEMKVYTADRPADLIRAHAMEAGPPVLPPKWMYTPWRWRDEHTQRTTYYDGTPVAGPFNSEVMEDVLMMKAFGIPNGIYWIDRPWGPGKVGYDDFEIDTQRLPHFAEMVRWLNSLNTKTFLWIAPFLNGKMAEEGIAKGYGLPGQKPTSNGTNYPLVDFTNPDARTFWQDGVAKLLKMGVAGFKLDRSEENIPEAGPYKVFDERSIRENRNAYPAMYVQAAYDVAKKYRGDDFVVMPRAGYTGSARYAVFWGGDIGGTQEGLRASIIAAQRAAVMGYPNWGSDTCGYNQQLMEQDVCGRWLGFSAFTPIMEVGPTRNVAFWNTPRDPMYDDVLIAIWRLYARLHERLVDYSYTQAKLAHDTGQPVIRPMFLADPTHPAAWDNWWTYEYGPDLVVSPIWEKGKRSQQVYLPAGSQWRDAWHPDKTYPGGQTIETRADLHQIPLFIRVGANLPIGDLNREWEESVAIARKRPDLKALESSIKLN
jgi:alpha-glucosidase (family GH31 glycosyl hydrolase)